MRKIEVGAPKLRGDDRQSAKEVFGDVEFPIRARVTNHMPCDVVLPEIGRVELLHVCNAQGLNSKVVEIGELDKLIRVVSSVEQVAELSRVHHALTIEEVGEDDQDSGEQSDGANNESDDGAQDSAGGEGSAATKAPAKSTASSGSKAKKGS